MFLSLKATIATACVAAVTLQVAHAQDDLICSLLPDDERMEQRLQFPTYTMPCPAVGERVNVELEFRKTLREMDPSSVSFTKSDIAFTVAHEGTACPVAGISYGWSFFDLGCEGLPVNLDDFTFNKVSGDEVTTGCGFWSGLSDIGGWCGTTGIGDAGTPETKMVLSVWNDGGCEGNLIFDAVLTDYPATDASIASGEPASACLTGFTPVCEEVSGGMSMGTFDPSRVCVDQEETSSCDADFVEVSIPDLGQTTTSCTCLDDQELAVCVLEREEECGQISCTSPEFGHRCPPEAVAGTRTVCVDTVSTITVSTSDVFPTPISVETTAYFRNGIQNVEAFQTSLDVVLNECTVSLVLPGGEDDFQDCQSCTLSPDGGLDGYDCTNLIPDGPIATPETTDEEDNSLFVLDIPTCMEIEESLPDGGTIAGQTADETSCECSEDGTVICTRTWTNACGANGAVCGETSRCVEDDFDTSKICRDGITVNTLVYDPDSKFKYPFQRTTLEVQSTFLQGVLEPERTAQNFKLSSDGEFVSCETFLTLEGVEQACQSCEICPGTDGARPVSDCTNIIPESVAEKCDAPPGSMILLLGDNNISDENDGPIDNDGSETSNPNLQVGEKEADPATNFTTMSFALLNLILFSTAMFMCLCV